MQVILTARMSNLGQIGEIVTVKNGYAKNFLIPQKKAIVYNSNNYKLFEARKNEFEASNADSIKVAQDIKTKIADKNIVIIENASDDGRLYGSVTTATIASKINEIAKTEAVTRGAVILSKPIKEIGLYDIILDIHGDVKISAKVVVSRSETEVDSIISGKKGEDEDFVEQEERQEKKARKNKKTKAGADNAEVSAQEAA